MKNIRKLKRKDKEKIKYIKQAIQNLKQLNGNDPITITIKPNGTIIVERNCITYMAM